MDHGAKGFYTKVLREFGLAAVSSVEFRREKAGHVCMCHPVDNSTSDAHRGSAAKQVIIQKSRGTKDSLRYAKYVLDKLHDEGIDNVGHLHSTESGSGEPFYEYDGELYTVAMYIGTSVTWETLVESDFSDSDCAAGIACAVAKIHKATAQPKFFEDFNHTLPKRKEHESFTHVNGFEKQLKLMQSFKKITKRQSRLSDFDVFFLKNFPEYEKRLHRTRELLRNNSRMSAGSFCHNTLKEEMVLRGSVSEQIRRKFYFTGFDECSHDCSLLDLASIVRRFLREAAAPTVADIRKILSSYVEEYTLDDDDFRALHGILIFPDRFHKACIKYYSKRRTFTPAAFESTKGMADSMNEPHIDLIESCFGEI